MIKHEENAPEMPTAIAPWWMDGETTSEILKEPHFMVKGINAFWRQVKSWLLWPMGQIDALTCSEQMLTVLAWERDITRFDSEPIELYRKRVKYAFINAKDAGEVAGFKRIFERLGVGFVEVFERLEGRDFDIIRIRLSDEQLAVNHHLLGEIIRYYGRTCRRYEFEVVAPVSLHMPCHTIDWAHQVHVAQL